MEERPDKEKLQEWINYAWFEGQGLTAWENEFIESISDQLDRRGDLSDRQIEILERIVEEKVP